MVTKEKGSKKLLILAHLEGTGAAKKLVLSSEKQKMMFRDYGQHGTRKRDTKVLAVESQMHMLKKKKKAPREK